MSKGRIIDATLRFVDRFSSPADKAIRKIQTIEKTYTKVGQAITATGTKITSAGKNLTAGITAPLVGVAAGAVKTAADFEASMSNVKAIMGEKYDVALVDTAKQLGATTAWSASEVAQAMQYTGMAGWDAQQNIEGLSGILNAASATGYDLAATSDIMTDAISAFGDKASDATRYSDVLTAACTSANVSMETLGESYKYCGAVSGAMKYSFEDVTTSLAAMGNQGIKGSTAGTTLRSAMSNMAAPTASAQKAMEKLGISVKNSDGSMKSWSDVVANLQSSFKNLTAAEQASYAKTIFGKSAMSGMLAIVNTSTEDYAKLTDGIKNSGNAAEEAAKTQLDNLNGQITLLKSALEGVAISIGSRFLPYMKDAVQMAQNVTTWFNNLSEEQANQIIKWAGIVAAIGPVLMAGGKVISLFGTMYSTGGKIIGLVATVKKFATAFGAAKAAGGGLLTLISGFSVPVLAVIAVIASLAAGAYLIYKNFDKVKESGKSVLNTLAPLFEPLKGQVDELLSKFSIIPEKINELCQSEGWKILTDVVTALFKFTFSATLSLAGNTLALFGKTALEIINSITDVFSGIITFLTGVFTGNWKKAWQGIVDIFGGIVKGITTVFKTPINGLIGMINSFIGGINSISIDIPDWSPVAGGEHVGFSVSTIPYLAKGTENWQGGRAVVNEKGGEIIDLPSGSRVYPHDKSIEMARAERNKDVVINLSCKFGDVTVREEADIDKIANGIAKRLKQVIENSGDDLEDVILI